MWTKLHKSVFGLCLSSVKRGLQKVSLQHCFSRVRKRGTRCRDSFFMQKCKWGYSLRGTTSFLLSLLSYTRSIGGLPIKDCDLLYPFILRETDFVTICRGASIPGFRPLWNSIIQFLHVGFKAEASLYTTLKRSLFSVHDFPSKTKIWITNRYCSFSIVLKSADTPASKRSPNSTTVPTLQKFQQ